MTAILANALVPIFGGLMLGYLAGIWRVMDNQNVQSLITFVMSFAIPCSLFLAVAGASLQDLRQQLAPACVLAIVYVVLYVVSFFWTRTREHLTLPDSAVLALTLGFPNSAAVGLPLLAAVFGPRSTVTVAASLAIGSITISPITLIVLEATMGGAPKGAISRKSMLLPLWHSIKKPIVWAPVAGLAFVSAGLDLPIFATRTLSAIGTASDGTALVLTGLVVSAQMFKISGSALFAVLLKNAIQPALALALACSLHLPVEQTRFVTLISAMPCGFFGVVFGKRFGSSPPLASSSLIASYIVGIPTLALWIVLLGHVT
jgi:malonate transporter and related proteins